ncbi:MAG: LuxR C-terminal-related transcriptional regulator [Acidimicrobiales bacterium]
MSSETASTLVGTKLAAPSPPSQLVRRPRLDDVLSEAVDDPAVRVVLVSAPAGSGKSTLIAAWLETTGTSCAWLQSDTADHDPARFWTHVVAALASETPDLEAAVAPALPGSGAEARPLVERLANHLAASSEPLILVIDDYHLISNPAIDQGLEQLVDLAPDSFTLVLCSRVDPSLRLSRLRVGGQLVEVRAADLRFGPQEAGMLLQQRGSTPNPGQVAALCERTEGWAAGLVMAGLSLAGTTDVDAFVAAFQGDDRLVVDYLTEEFLSGISPEDQNRLLCTSILHRLTGPLIDAVCATTDGATWLRDLASTNQLLISLDRTGTWFRYHHLLGDLLRREAEDSPGIDIAELHRRAGHWHRHHGSPHDAVEHYISGQNLTEAADLIYDEAHDLLNRGQLATVRRQIVSLGSIADQHAGIAVVNGMISLLTGELADARRYLVLARSLGPDEDEIRLTIALAVYIAIASGDVASALHEAQASDDPTESTQALSLAVARTWGGDFAGAEPLLHLAERLSDEEGNALVTTGPPIYAAIAAIETAKDADARRTAERALEIAESRGWFDVPQVALAHSIIGRTSADPDEAIAAAALGVELANESAMVLTRGYALTSYADVLSRFEHPDSEELRKQARSVIDRCPDPGIAGRYLARIEARHGALPSAPEVAGLVDNLTEREQAVLHYLPSQLTQRDIAAELYVSLNTVRTHCKAIYRKLGVGDRKAAVQAARDLGLL